MDNTILGGIRVLDLANENGVFCTRQLAELGAEVIKIEPLEGDSTRKIGPFAEGEPQVEKSLFHAFYNGGKKSITLNLEKTEGKKLFLELVKQADVLVETSKPGTMEAKGLGYDDLKKMNPKLIMCSITPFGQEGPYSKWNASSDLIPYGMTGPMFETGVPGKEPLQLGLNFTANLTGVLATSGIIALITASAESGEGGYLDMSLFKAAGSWRCEYPGIYQYYNKITSRIGSQGMFVPMNYYPCKDGFVQLLGSSKWDQMIAWMKELNIDVGHFDEPKYGGPSYFNDALVAERSAVDALVTKLTLKYNKEDFMVEAQKRGIPAGASETPKSIMESPHYQARDMFVEVEHEPLGTYKTVGTPFKFSKADVNVGKRPPFLGENNEEIYKQLGLTTQDLAAYHAQHVL